MVPPPPRETRRHDRARPAARRLPRTRAGDPPAPPRSAARGTAPVLAGQPPPAAGQWRYWRPAGAAVVEFGALRGREVGLPPHFHAEDQLTIVLSGRRRFILGGRMVVLAAGQGALIPAGTPHRSLAEPEGVLCLNAYLPAGSDAASDAASLAPAGLDRILAGPIRQLAAAAGMSREGFTRRFAERHGMPPQAFRRIGRLNRARALLRAGEGIAAAAAAAGFADQSHLGRCFRRVFGVTPGRYRAGEPPSQPFQTGR